MNTILIIAGILLLTHQSIAQIITGGESGADKVDPSKIKSWMTDQKTDYQVAYHFGFSDGESLFLLIVTGDSCYAQLKYGEFVGSHDYTWNYIPFKNVRIEGNKFFSDKTDGEFVVYSRDNKQTKGLIVYKPWRRKLQDGISEFGFYQSPVQVWFSGKFPYASYRFLNETELKELSPLDLMIMRNEIYARYSYIFRPDGEIDRYFRNQKWYGAKNENVDNFMTGLEKQNIKLIQKIEKK